MSAPRRSRYRFGVKARDKAKTESRVRSQTDRARLSVERRLYADLIGLATGAFHAFGLCSLPMGWLADRFGRRTMLAAFFFSCGLSCLGLSTATGSITCAGGLLVLGVASAIYHPVGSAMLVTHARRLGRDLGVNGVWGNLGAACASPVTALLAAALGWRAAFILPGLICLAAGAAFVLLEHRPERWFHRLPEKPMQNKNLKHRPGYEIQNDALAGC